MGSRILSMIMYIWPKVPCSSAVMTESSTTFLTSLILVMVLSNLFLKLPCQIEEGEELCA